MPNAKKNYRKRTYRRRRYGGAKTMYKIAKKVLSNSCEKKEINVETGADLRPGYSSGAVVIAQLTAIPQGDTMETREGREIIAKSVEIRGKVQLGGSADETSLVRVTLVRMLQQEKDTPPTEGQIYRTVGSTNIVNSMWSRQQNGGRYRVLRDFVMSLKPDNNSVTGTGAFKFFKIKVLLNFKVRYNGTAATDIDLNGVYLLVSSTQANSTSKPDDTPYLSYRGRLIYIDP